MAERFLKNTKDGTIYRWNPIIAAHPACVEVTAQEAFPEKYMKPEQAARAKKSRSVRKSGLDLTTEDVDAEPPQVVAPEIAADASRGLPE